MAGSLLLLYEKAIELRRFDVAEHLLEALEELAKAGGACQTILDEAYGRIVRLPRPDA